MDFLARPNGPLFEMRQIQDPYADCCIIFVANSFRKYMDVCKVMSWKQLKGYAGWKEAYWYFGIANSAKFVLEVFFLDNRAELSSFCDRHKSTRRGRLELVRAERE